MARKALDWCAYIGKIPRTSLANFCRLERVVPRALPIRVVVVTMYESALETGDHYGEFRLWVERLPLNERIPFPHGFRDLRYNSEKNVIGIVSGVGTRGQLRR